MYNFKFNIKLVIFSMILMIAEANKKDHLYIISDYENQTNCSGEITRITVFYEHKFWTETQNAMITCEPLIIPVQCTIESKFYQTEIFTQNQCNKGRKLEIININDFILDKSNFCLLSEYSTSTCDYKPIFSFGIKNGYCVDGITMECSELKYKISTCDIIEKDPKKFKITTSEFSSENPTLICKNSIGYLNETLRGFRGQPFTLDGVIDPFYVERVLQVPLKNNINNNNNNNMDEISNTTSSFSFINNLFFIAFIIIKIFLV
ncbi:hypothetical protein RB653_004304 [Dictyostelium firmibasis]|uniref:Uncharacterized protein n=1 Tax=Dictyostelium firmibasis TaxID=79012 RepID=A0AAN7TZF2_9MYCE